MRLVVIDEQIAPKVAKSLALLDLPVQHVTTIAGLGAGTPDQDILKFCGKHGRALITLDRKMYTKPHERALIKAHKVGVFFIRSGSKTVLLPLEISNLIGHNWRAIEDTLKNERRPFMKRLQPGRRMMDYETKQQRRKGKSGKKKGKKR